MKQNKKTAVQEVFIELEKLHPNLFDIYTEKGRQFVNHFHKFLQVEKEQIYNAYIHSKRSFSAGIEPEVSAENYYELTYKNNDNA
jgi:hypothetical protein